MTPVTASSAPAAEPAGDVSTTTDDLAEGQDDQTADVAEGPPPDTGASWHPTVVPAMLAIVVGAMVAIMLATHRSGHWWGDDWALYIRQAQSLIDGNPGEVTADNRFTTESSLGAPFSPPLYPWGFPIVLVPFVAVVGVDIDALHVVPVLCAAVFACAWFALARRRIGLVAAFVGVVAATLTPLLLSWSELIQSEWPFLAVTFALLVAVDRAVESRVLVDVTARWWPLVLLGVGAAAAFTVRREGLAMTPAIAAAQLGLLTTGVPGFTVLFREWRLAARVLVPHLSALATVLALQRVLPSTLVPQYSGTSITNAWTFGDKHIRHLAEVSGLKRHWESDASVLGSTTLGSGVIGLYFVLAAIGVVLAVSVNRRRDLHLVVYALVAFLIGASFRSALNRYVATVGPVLFLLGLVALVAVFGHRRPGRGRAVAAAAALLIVAGNLANAADRIDSADRAAAAGTVEWGPTHPAAVEMFDAVRDLTEAGDVVAGPKARALTLLTDRRAIQVDRWRPLPSDWTPDLVVTEAGTPPDDVLRDDPRYEQVWSNSRFVVYTPVTPAPGS